MRHTYVSRLFRIPLLAPDLVEAILDGRQPRGMTAQELRRDVPVGWAEQWAKLPVHPAAC